MVLPLLKDIVKRVLLKYTIYFSSHVVPKISWKLDSTQAIQNYLKHTSAHVTSFDLGEHPYVTHAKEYIDAYYPGRHSLILGDSTVTVPKCIGKYDVIFIDGGHDYEVASADLQNAKKLARKNTIVMDDTMYSCMGSSVYGGSYQSMARDR